MHAEENIPPQKQKGKCVIDMISVLQTDTGIKNHPISLLTG